MAEIGRTSPLCRQQQRHLKLERARSASFLTPEKPSKVSSIRPIKELFLTSSSILDGDVSPTRRLLDSQGRILDLSPYKSRSRTAHVEKKIRQQQKEETIQLKDFEAAQKRIQREIQDEVELQQRRRDIQSARMERKERSLSRTSSTGLSRSSSTVSALTDQSYD
eukprot:jgi/Mesvir1/27115/Mv20793-RA.1